MSDLNEVINSLAGVKKLLNSIKFKEILTGDRLSEEKVEKIKSATDESVSYTHLTLPTKRIV